MQGFQESKLSKWIIMLCFFLIIGILPLIEFGKEIYRKEHIIEFDIFRGIPTNEKVRSYEKAIEDNSIIAKLARSWLQLPLTCFGDQGNKKVIIGRDKWLFYRPSFDYATKPNDNFHGESRPFEAIIAFNNTLKEQNVDLILLPIPGKSSIYPEHLTKRYKSEFDPPVNIYADEFFQKLRDEGIKIVDPANILWKTKELQDKMLYLEQDTHWSPNGMEIVARYLSDDIIANALVDCISKESYKIQRDRVTRYGDLYDMLGFPEGYSCYQPKSIEIGMVIDSKTGEQIKPNQKSPIVLLGDSFVNIFSKAEMGWGEYAGFAEHLAYNLGIPIDVIAINDGGATGSREQLARRPNALVGKRLVIWQFPTRDLTNPESQWKIVNIPKPQKMAKKIEIPKPQKTTEPEKEVPAIESIKQEEPKEQNLIVTGEVILVSNVPDPSQVAYSDCLTYIKYRVISVENGEYKDSEIIAVFWGMQKSKLMPAAKFQIGEKHRLKLDPLSNHQELSHFMQADDTNDYERIPYWAIEMTQQ
jgi:alginate O-acetyltransferase complex protein AlgJ